MKTVLKVKEIVADVLCLPVEKVNDEEKFFDELGGDSIDLVDVTIELEKEFNIHYCPDDGIFSNHDVSVEDIIADVKQKMDMK